MHHGDLSDVGSLNRIINASQTLRFNLPAVDNISKEFSRSKEKKQSDLKIKNPSTNINFKKINICKIKLS